MEQDQLLNPPASARVHADFPPFVGEKLKKSDSENGAHGSQFRPRNANSAHTSAHSPHAVFCKNREGFAARLGAPIFHTVVPPVINCFAAEMCLYVRIASPIAGIKYATVFEKMWSIVLQFPICKVGVRF
jgi:hypothetical protein